MSLVATVSWSIYSDLSAFHALLYRSDALKSQKGPSSKIQKVAFYIPSSEVTNAKKALAQAKAITDGMSLTQDLGNLPANICTPTYLAKQARTLPENTNLISKFSTKTDRSPENGQFSVCCQGQR